MENDYFKDISSLTKDLRAQGFEPILVGGMALILLGSQRVTYDFDFLVSAQGLLVETIIDIFYRHGFELVSKLNEKREIIRTIDNPRIAAIRIKLDEPSSVYFFNHKTELKIDLLLDFPFSAKEVAVRSQKIKIRSHTFRIACRDDLIRMKEMAYKDRKLASDAHDLEFLKNLSKNKRL